MKRKTRNLFNAAERWRAPPEVNYVLSYNNRNGTVHAYVETSCCRKYLEIDHRLPCEDVRYLLDLLCSRLLADHDEKLRMDRMRYAVLEAGITFEIAMIQHMN